MKQELGQVFRPLQEINALTIIAVVAAAWLLVAVVERLFPWIAGRLPPRFRLYILPFVPGLRLVILAGALAQIATEIIWPAPENLFALFGAAGVALGFAFKDYVSSLVAGVVATYERPYRPGDWVRIGDVYGEVHSVGLRAIEVFTSDDTMVTIPHSKIWTEAVWNANDGARDHMCVADFYLDPDHDAAAVRERLRDVALTSPYLNLERRLSVSVREEPFATHYRVKAYPTDNRDEFQFVSDLTVRGKAALAELGVRPARMSVAVAHAAATG